MKMTPEENLARLGIELPPAPKPLGSYVPARRSGNLVFLSGILPLKEGKLLKTGRVGESITVEEARGCARQCVINALAVLKAELGGLGRVRGCVRVGGYIASAPDFTEQPKVLNAASDLLFEILGEPGRHSRAAVGVNVLPLGSPLEIEFIFEVQ
jgi:enamine deaminase RidA (YjgF/YER057c/UK114 family)